MNWQESRINCTLGLATWHKLRCLAELESNKPLPNESENTLSLVSELTQKAPDFSSLKSMISNRFWKANSASWINSHWILWGELGIAPRPTWKRCPSMMQHNLTHRPAAAWFAWTGTALTSKSSFLWIHERGRETSILWPVEGSEQKDQDLLCWLSPNELKNQ